MQRGATRGYQVVLTGPVGGQPGLIESGGTEYSPRLDLACVPPRLEEHFSAIRNESAWTYTRIGTIDDSGAVVSRNSQRFRAAAASATASRAQLSKSGIPR